MFKYCLDQDTWIIWKTVFPHIGGEVQNAFGLVFACRKDRFFASFEKSDLSSQSQN